MVGTIDIMMNLKDVGLPSSQFFPEFLELKQR